MPIHRARVAGLVVALALAACGSPGPEPTSSLGPPATAGTTAATQSPAGEPAGAGRPYDAAAVLAAMRASTRPGGVPDQLQTDVVATAVAGQLWTWDGVPWQSVSIGGACGPRACDLDVAGQSDGMAGADLYAFSVDPASGEVTLASTDLHGYPAELADQLDEMARAATGDDLEDLAFVSARWLPPPDEGRFWLAYRSGGEEGAPGLDLLLDAASGQVVERREV